MGREQTLQGKETIFGTLANTKRYRKKREQQLLEVKAGPGFEYEQDSLRRREFFWVADKLYILTMVVIISKIHKKVHKNDEFHCM
jgi:hypothetical protein